MNKRERASRAARGREKRSSGRVPVPGRHPDTPHLCLLRSPAVAQPRERYDGSLQVATYNVHRWMGLSGRTKPDPSRAHSVISELDADVMALQEVIRPFDGEDPVASLADSLGLHVAFAATRVHKTGELGNAILSRWPILGLSMLDLTRSRLEKRVALCAQLDLPEGLLQVVATHLALAPRTRRAQVRSLLDHPQLRSGSAVLMGDMNSWRRCRASRTLDDELEPHGGTPWPASFPSLRPVLALDRIYGRGVLMTQLQAHSSVLARRASDHLPVSARVELSEI
ncbi:endonuclease/exonuclease/phosphatase family protein [Myxococcota bacterium]|nr:endonuclease/exonuclease/phosphatase family protein [Myxococcota bacterium]